MDNKPEQGINYLKKKTLVELVEYHTCNEDYKKKILIYAVALIAVNEYIKHNK